MVSPVIACLDIIVYRVYVKNVQQVQPTTPAHPNVNAQSQASTMIYFHKNVYVNHNIIP